jgi:SAM-dependent methyltransferase
MTADLAGFKHGIAERFVPDLMQGTLIEAEHLARYRWAAQLAAGRRVLDAGCGTGYGCALLAEAGAEDVVGVDIAAGVLDSVCRGMPEAVRLDDADLGDLPYADGEFDLIVCFDVLEHLDDPGPALDQIVRVLAADGVLLASTPNRAVHSPTSPHHRHEFLPDELAEELRARLDKVTLVRQDVYLTVAVLGDADFLAGDRDLSEIALQKVATGERDTEEFTLAVAGRSELPEVPPLALLASSLQVKRWLTAFGEERAVAAANRARILELEERTKELATVPNLQSQVAALDAELARVREEKEGVLARAEHAERVLGEVWSSLSWRLTSPLRRLKGFVRSLKT